MKITGAQIRAARGFLKWSVSKLADTADVGISTIQKIEDAAEGIANGEFDPKPGQHCRWQPTAG